MKRWASTAKPTQPIDTAPTVAHIDTAAHTNNGRTTMQVQRQWQDEEAVFDMVAEALASGIDPIEGQIAAMSEEDSYGNHGYIRIRTADGRTFGLQLTEEL